MKNTLKKYACGAAVVAFMGLPLTNVALAQDANNTGNNNNVHNTNNTNNNHANGNNTNNHNDRGVNNTSNTNNNSDSTMDRAGEAISDSWITSKVKSSFLADSQISGMDIKVETNQGVVSLSGKVDTDAERELAIQKARDIEGVTSVAADGLKTAE